GYLVADAALEAPQGAATLLLPPRDQPSSRAAPGRTPEQRAEMLELAVAGNSRFQVERVERDLRTPSYTVRTLRALAAREPGNRFTLLLGADAAGELSGWHEVEALPGLADLVVFARAGVAIPHHPLIGRVVDVPAVDVSATLVRERVRLGRSIRYLVPEAVRGYITAHGLYR